MTNPFLLVFYPDSDLLSSAVNNGDMQEYWQIIPENISQNTTYFKCGYKPNRKGQSELKSIVIIPDSLPFIFQHET